MFVTLADGKTNTLANGGSFNVIDDSNIDAAVFSKQDLTFNGTGSLTVSSPAGHGIACKDDLVFTGCTFIGTGAAGMAQSFSDSTQSIVAVWLETQNAGTSITRTDINGDTLISYSPELSFAVVILSSPDIVSGESYTIAVGSLLSELKAS